jgi:hypothetical protein
VRISGFRNPHQVDFRLGFGYHNRMKRRVWPLHPMFFALAPILFAYAHNVRRIPIRAQELVLPALVILGLSFLLWVLLALALRSWTRGAVVVSLAQVLLFLAGRLPGARSGSGTGQFVLLAVLIIALAVVLVLTLRAKGSLAGLTLALDAAALALVLTNLATALPGMTRRGHDPNRFDSGSCPLTLAPADAPDIYYIILDAYVRADYLKRVYDVDNADFRQDLECSGFMIAGRGRSNYTYTYASLASSLNFTYLDRVAQAQGPASTDARPLIDMIQDSRLVDVLKRHGYRLVTFASGYTGTELENADVRFAPFWQLSEFQSMVLGTMMLTPLTGFVANRLEDRMQAGLIRYVLRTLPGVRQSQRPSFIFAHVVCPHAPFVFDAQGAQPKIREYVRLNPTSAPPTVSRKEFRKWFRANYGPQVQYLDRLLLETVRRILADSLRPAVVIFQGDHGPYDQPGKFQIFNAIRVPPGAVRNPQAPAFYDSITPVNTFRVLLSQLADTTLALLPDRSYSASAASPRKPNPHAPQPDVDSPTRF